MAKLATKAKLYTVLALVLGALLILLSATQPWFEVQLNPLSGAVSHELTVAGSDAVALLVPLAVTVLALAAVVALASRPWRYLLAVLLLLIAGVVAWVSIQAVFVSPVAAVATTVTEATGMSGLATVSALIAQMHTTFWPYLALASAFLLIVVALVMLLTNHLWAQLKKRSFETAAQRESQARAAENGARPFDAASSDQSDSWDLLSGGVDPTSDR